MDIIRNFPKKKDEYEYTKRYTKNNFDEYNKIIKNLDKYEMLKNGINYKTNRKIKIGGDTYNKLLQNDFTIKEYGYSYIPFEKLNGIDSEIYLQETETIKKEIQDYNLQIDNICDEITKLELWNDYIVFEGRKYGIPKIYNKIHKENDCNGLFKIINWIEYHSNKCENGWDKEHRYCGTIYNYKCDKCNYEYSI